MSQRQPPEADQRDRARRRRRPAPLSPLGRLLRSNADWSATQRERMEAELFFEGDRWRPFVRRYVALLFFASMIAALGLIADSAAVVIGAMLVSPLMTPIVAASAALVTGDLRRLAISFAVLAAGIAIGVVVGWAMARIAGVTIDPQALNDQLLARTEPKLLDLGIAVVSGLAAGYVLTDRDAIASIPGVAIAVALVPPLVTSGILVAVGDADLAAGSALLFATNLVAILFAAGLVLLCSGYVDRHRLTVHHRRVGVGLALSALCVLLLAVPLAVHTRSEILDEVLRSDVSAAIEQWSPDMQVLDMTVDHDGSAAEVDVTLSGPHRPPPTAALAAAVRERSGVDRVATTVRFRLETSSSAAVDR